MSLRSVTRSAAQLGGGAAAIYATWATLRRLEERTANAKLAVGKRFIILGGGFAGAAVAQELARLLPGEDNGEVLLVDQDNYLLFTPMLTEAVGGEVGTRDIVSPVRSLPRKVSFVQGQITKIDLQARSVDVKVGTAAMDPTIKTYTGDQLVIALGSVVNFHDTPGVAENALTVKRLDDAERVLQRVSACLERAAVEDDADKRKVLLTFVVGGGGYTGVETMASVNDLVRSMAAKLPRIRSEEVRTLVVEPGDRLLPEITPELAAYATKKLKEHGVEVRLQTRIEGAGADFVTLQGGERIATRTFIWTAGVTPSPLLKDLPAPKGKHHGLTVNGSCEVPGYPGVWALGDCAEIPEPDGKGTYAPTAQNATREGKMVAQNIVKSLRGTPLEVFRFTPIGELALVGRHSGVARVYGRNFSGLLAWAMWRAVYLAKMPGFAQRSRILTDWILDVVFDRAAIPLSSAE
ncbi:MAG: NAD(P)/FAD-dependent oxidoreductase [Janthinobacterium lividum]